MDRQNPNKDNRTSNASGRGLHTYTPRSHEDLLRSHLQLDASRNAKLQQELRRLSDENHKLKKYLKDKDDEMESLRDRLAKREKSLERSQSEPRSKIFEIDGKPVTLDEIINHFTGVIDKHHDLLNKKNQKIHDLEELLRKAGDAPSRKPKDDRQDMNDLAKELVLIRKEYEQVEYILTDRNNKLERMIEDLQRKLDQYADEIEHLRRELKDREGKPNENLQRLILEKEKENEYLKDIINSLKNNRPVTNIPDSNVELENEIRRIIQDKKNAVDKLNNMITDLKNTPSDGVTGQPDFSGLENECQAMLRDLNDMNDKLNNLIIKIKETPSGGQGEPFNKDELLTNLNILKGQCEDEIEALKNQIKHGTTDSRDAPVLYTGQAQMRIDDPEFFRRGKRSKESSGDEPITMPSNIKFILYPERESRPSNRESQPSNREDRPSQPRIRPTSLEIEEIVITSRNKLYPEIPSETSSHRPRHYPAVACEACESDYIPESRLRQPPMKQEKEKEKHDKEEKKIKPKPKKKGCCGGKGSTSSNVPYDKACKEEKTPEGEYKEEVMKVYSTHSQQKNPPHRTKSDKSPQRPKTPTTPEDSPKAKRKLISNIYPNRSHSKERMKNKPKKDND